MSDLRNQVYPENGLNPFPGEGRVVGQQRIHKLSVGKEYPGELGPEAEPGGGGAVQDKLQVASFTITHSPSLGQGSQCLPAGSRVTAEKFLNRFPKFVIRQGEVIDIRGPMRDTLQVRPALAPQLSGREVRGGFAINPGTAYQSSGFV